MSTALVLDWSKETAETYGKHNLWVFLELLVSHIANDPSLEPDTITSVKQQNSC